MRTAPQPHCPCQQAGPAPAWSAPVQSTCPAAEEQRPPQLSSGRCEGWERPELGDMGGQTKPLWEVLANCRIKWYKSLQPHLPEKMIAGAALTPPPPPPGRPPEHSRRRDSGCLGPQSGGGRGGPRVPAAWPRVGGACPVLPPNRDPEMGCPQSLPFLPCGRRQSRELQELTEPQPEPEGSPGPWA